ncbi:hypothetical protein AsAng_0041380 [Aureispira anguillae]|uniref:Uncharacterized protein n=1 Tax=Aureispira anguillae TaxID=2864201 RepID=A0A916DUJ0_9BACT|nr:hypothetical protein AsAng_0041380 [Aureispira anguillae]
MKGTKKEIYTNNPSLANHIEYLTYSTTWIFDVRSLLDS